MPILSYFLIEANSKNQLHFYATDLNIGLTIKVDADIKEEGDMLLSSKKLFSIVRELPEKPIHVWTNGAEGWCNITCEKSHFKIPYLVTESFPKKPDFPEEFSNVIPSNIILSILDKTLFATANDETRYNLNCIFMMKLPESGWIRIVATDGHRMVQMDVSALKDLQLDESIMIPKRGMIELKRILNEAKVKLVGFEIKGKNTYFQIDNISMSVRLMDGDYPDYQQVIPKMRGRLIHINRWDLMTGLRRVSRIATEDDESTKFFFRKNELGLKMGNSNSGIASETIDIPYEGDPIVFAFNYRYCLDILGAIEEEEIEMELIDEDNPGVFRGKGNDDTFYLIMPMSIRDDEEYE